MDQSKHKMLIVFLLSLLILVIASVLSVLFWGNNQSKTETPIPEEGMVQDEKSESKEEIVTYTEEELQKALDKPLEQTEINSQTPVNKEEEQKQLQEALTKPAPKEEATNYTQEELESALRK